MNYETVIGLEVHVELLTDTKVFCSCACSFGGEPNTRICEVCTGMPGALPSLNKKVVEYAVRTGLATNCSITRVTRFDRKNYFYPDLPKGYQISQLYAPICTDGFIEIKTEKRRKKIRIHEIHIEEDAGKLIHTADATLIDFNRCGVPLLEIVTEPDFSDSDEVIAFLEALKKLLSCIGVSDCKMQEGSMRADVNLSVKKASDEALGTRTEMKNLNSFHDIADTIKNEAARQTAILENGGKVVRQTRRWDADRGESFEMRSKETADDYRYFPEPDIPAIEITDEETERIKNALPELPDAKKERYTDTLGLSEYDASLLSGDVHLAAFFEELTALGISAKEAANWILGELLRLLKESSEEAENCPLKAQTLAAVIKMVQSGRINRNTGKAVLEKAYYEGINPEKYIEENSLSLITDEDEIVSAVNAVITGNEKSVSDYRNGKTAALGYLIGQTMKALGGRAPANEVRRIILQILG